MPKIKLKAKPRKRKSTRSRSRARRDHDFGDIGMAELGESEEEFLNGEGGDSSGSSDVEDLVELLVDFDKDGIPKKIAEDNHVLPKLPPEFKGVMLKRRFRNKYAGPSIHETILFANTKAMTKVGKLDRKLQRAVNKFQAVGSGIEDDATIGQLPAKTSPKVVVTYHALEADIQKWLYSNLKFSSSVDTLGVKSSLASIYAGHFTMLKRLFPTTGKRLHMLLRKVLGIGDICVSKVLEGQLHSISVVIPTIRDLLREVTEKMAEKSTMIDWLQVYKNTVQSSSPEFDETSIRGLKPLRVSLNPPYFKDWYARTAAPTIFRRSKTTNLMVLVTSMKQKWTLKDARELQSSILNSVLEKKLTEAKELSDSMEAKFIHGTLRERATKIIAEVNTGKTGTGEGSAGFRRGRGRGRGGGGLGRSRAQKNIPVSDLAQRSGDIANSLRACTSLTQVRDWLRKESTRIRKIKYDHIFDEGGMFTVKDVDWDDVSAKLMNQTKKLRLPEDCQNCFLHAANPVYDNRRRWNDKEKTLLKNEAENLKEWDQISNCFPKRRPEFVVFYKWRKTFNAPKKIAWGKEKEEMLRFGIKCYGANWNRIPVELNDFGATKKQVQERFKKTLNPVLRFGKFTRVEDSLMLLTIEKLKGHFRREKHFGILTAFLPWRYESAWRDRVENLFSEYIVPWTLPEDKKLMQLAKTMKRDWSKIAQEFNSFKTRKGCLTRFKILEKRLCSFKSLEQYHDAYAMIRYNVQEYQHLKDISALLKKIMEEEVFVFSGLPRDRSPTEEELQEFILSFDRDVMASTIQMIDTYVTKRDESWSEWRKKNGIEQGTKRKTHDRRTFHAEDTQSIASALHIREVKLIPQENLKFKLTQRETQIYGFYARFCSTKALKKDKPRPYIPVASALVVLPDVRRIVVKQDPAPGDPVPIVTGRKRKAKKLPVVKEDPAPGDPVPISIGRKRKAKELPVVNEDPGPGDSVPNPMAGKRKAKKLPVVKEDPAPGDPV